MVCRRASVVSRAAFLAWASLAAVAIAWPQDPSPSPRTGEPAEERGGGSPRGRRGRLRLDVDRHVEDALEKQAADPTPRFETSIEVLGKSPQVMLERYFRGLDLECGPAGVGAPTEAETREARPVPAPYIDLAALAQALARRSKGEGPPRFFLYRITGGQVVRYILRTERVPASWLHNLPGTTFELVETFADAAHATQAWRRVHRGFETLLPEDDGSPLPPWSTADCRPRGTSDRD